MCVCVCVYLHIVSLILWLSMYLTIVLRGESVHDLTAVRL